MTNRQEHSPDEQSNAVIYGFFDHYLRAIENKLNDPPTGSE
jgi:hypothetical protein